MNKANSASIVLRVKVHEGNLYRNVVRIGKMSPFVEVYWNDLVWSSKVAKDQHTAPVWEDFHTFESTEPGPITIKVFNNNLVLPSQEIGRFDISEEDLFKTKTKDWFEIFSEGKVVGKLKVTASMYEEKRTDISTHNTSYAYVDLKEEYYRRLNELELEKEELEFYRMKYKKKQQKLNQDKRMYKSTLTEIVKKQTPQHTEESSDDEFRVGNQLSGPTTMKKLSQESQKKVMYKTLNSQVALDLQRFREDRVKGKKKNVKFSNTFDWMNGNSESSRGGLRVEDSQEEPRSDILELRFNASNQFETPRRVLTPSQMGYLTSNSSSRSSRNMDRVLFD